MVIVLKIKYVTNKHNFGISLAESLQYLGKESEEKTWIKKENISQ
jgi:hypothetical protein